MLGVIEQGSRVKGWRSNLQHIRQGCIQHNQVCEEGAKVGDRTWGQFLQPPKLQLLMGITDPTLLAQ